MLGKLRLLHWFTNRAMALLSTLNLLLAIARPKAELKSVCSFLLDESEQIFAAAYSAMICGYAEAGQCSRMALSSYSIQVNVGNN